MLQIYPIYSYGDDHGQEAFGKLNCFLAKLDEVGVGVSEEGVSVNIKTYPDYGTTATTITVALHLCHEEKVSQVRDIHRDVVNIQPEQVPAPESEEKPVTVPADDDFDPFLDGDETLP